MLFFIRFTYIALLLIFTQLLVPAFRPGGRLLIIVIASATAFGAQLIRKFSAGKLKKFHQIPLSGGSVIIMLLLGDYLFSRVKLTFLGILFTYLGVILLEMLLPDQWRQLVYQKYQRPE